MRKGLAASTVKPVLRGHHRDKYKIANYIILSVYKAEALIEMVTKAGLTVSYFLSILRQKLFYLKDIVKPAYVVVLII
jgi:cytochrome c oxidase subunit IV